MNTTTFINRIKDIAYTSKGKFSARYENALSQCKRLSQGQRIYPYKWVKGSRHHFSLNNQGDKLRELLKRANVSYNLENDAPRGGIEGDYIILDRKGANQLVNVDFDHVFNCTIKK